MGIFLNTEEITKKGMCVLDFEKCMMTEITTFKKHS